ncbi:relaxasome subunit MobC [Blautia massiliensis (ex Durand et al. 2017)]|uniref:relaxasome subunit MobC n=1 Tax=Blautia massiliensis (ex Durand et al. 2017) TaxID=1737424 RepID=UPI0022E0C763|nr:relaxasome subunit MobC [Blautia massiliensis (ex Durand et al. 2017)]
MARSTKSYEERMLQLEKKEQESLEKAKQYAAQKRELKKRQKDVETKKLGSAIEEDDIPKLIGFLKRQEANGKFFSKAMQKEPVANTEEV